MVDYQIRTPRLLLIPMSPEWMEAMREGGEKFKAVTGYFLPEPYTEFPEAMDQIILHLKSLQTSPPWLSYAVVRPSDATYIGQAGFKGKPDEAGVVEIGYEIAKGVRLQGYANEVIRHLIHRAFEHPEIMAILAHTLPLKNESNHLLIKNKFVFQTEIVEPEDGPVWQWILKKNAYRFARLQEERLSQPTD
jgi:ribosomal-protein-alanine N-acetyltransferase